MKDDQGMGCPTSPKFKFEFLGLMRGNGDWPFRYMRPTYDLYMRLCFPLVEYRCDIVDVYSRMRWFPNVRPLTSQTQSQSRWVLCCNAIAKSKRGQDTRCTHDHDITICTLCECEAVVLDAGMYAMYVCQSQTFRC